jgi:hypothetical protein
MKTLARLMLAGALAVAFGQSGYAQMTPPAAPAAPVAPATPVAPKAPAMPKPKVPMSPKAKECSDKATAQGLHGKARKEYREKCKKGET